MKQRKSLKWWLMVLCLVVSMPLSAALTAEQDEVLNNIVSGALSERENILKAGVYKDFRVYRDGQKFGVVYDYIVAGNQPVTIDKGVKATVVNIFRPVAELAPHFKNGMYIRFNYLRPDGKVILTFTVNQQDF